jgi:hypothetical protein
MSAGSWIADALLGSPIPPPNWLDPRHGGPGWHAPYGGYFSGPMHVSGSYIQAELADLNSCVNPPVIQGWAWCLALACAGAALLGIRSAYLGSPAELSVMVLTLGPLPAWVCCVLAGGYVSHDVELRRDSLYVRRWTDVWLGRRGRLVGSRSSVHAALSCGTHLQLEGDAESIVVSMAMWPSSSRRDLEDRFEKWGIELEFPGRHHAHHPAHWNHGRHRFGHRLAEQRSPNRNPGSA